MTKKKKMCAHAHENHYAAIVMAIIALATLAGADVFSAPTTQTIAHANTSANPYRPVGTYVPASYPSYDNRAYPVQSSVSSLPKATLIRKIKTLERSAKTIGRQLLGAENRIDTFAAALESASPKNTLELRSALGDLTALRNRLEQRLAETNTKLENYKLQLQ